MVDTTRNLLATVKKRHLRFLVHVFKGNDLQKNVLLPITEKRRTRGRQRRKCMNDIKEIEGREDIKRWNWLGIKDSET